MKIAQEKSGSLLLELIIVIGVVAIIVPIIAQVIMTSLNANKWSMDNKVAAGLADEAMKAVEGISFEKWQNIYDQLKSADDHYYPSKSAGSWVINTGEESITANTLSYQRYFTISNVCRNDSDGSVVTGASFQSCGIGTSDDPSTQKITITVTWRNNSFSRDYYLTRWRNQVCNQTAWVGTGSGPVTCPNAIYESATNIDTTSVPGSIKLKAN